MGCTFSSSYERMSCHCEEVEDRRSNLFKREWIYQVAERRLPRPLGSQWRGGSLDHLKFVF